MKIAQINVYFYPAMVGGAEWYVYNISRELVRRGHEVHVYAADTYQGKKILPADDEVAGIYVHRIPLWLNLTYRAKIWRGLQSRLLQEDFDIIHTYDYAQPHSYVAVKAGETAKKPVALTIFDVHTMIPRPFYKRLFMRIFDNYLAKITLRGASRILVRAPNLISPLVDMGASNEKTYVTPSGIIEEALHPADGSVFLKEYSISGRPVILYLGRLHSMKGPQYLIMASPAILQKYPDTAFVFVGPDQKNYKDELIRLSEKLGVRDHLVFTGPVYDFEMKMQAYAASDLFVLPSGYEGTSQAVWEAMAQAKPIVATDRGGIPFQVEHEKEAVLVGYGDERALASAILRLLDDRKMAASLGFRAREKVKSFTYPILVSQIENIYRDMLRK